MSPDELLQGWSFVEIVTSDGQVGYAPRTSIARAAAGELTATGDFRSQMPLASLPPTCASTAP